MAWGLGMPSPSASDMAMAMLPDEPMEGELRDEEAEMDGEILMQNVVELEMMGHTLTLEEEEEKERERQERVRKWHQERAAEERLARLNMFDADLRPYKRRRLQ